MNSETFENESLIQRLNERAKELECLYRVKEIISGAREFDDAFSGITEIIPSGWQS